MNPTRNVGLDVLRAVAVLMVIARHMTPPAPWPWLRQIMEGGWAGVDLFFVLSGFLVSGLLFQEYATTQRVDYPRFFWRRGLKIYPAFFTLVLIYGAFEYFVGGAFIWKRLVAEVLFVQNYFPPLWNHTWSLAIEEHFYLFIGLTVAYLAERSRMDRVPAIAMGVLAGCLLLRSIEVATAGRLNDFATHLRIDSLMFGVLLSYLYHNHGAELARFFTRVRPVLLPAALLSLVTLAIYPFGHVYWQTVGYSMLYAAFGSLMMYTLAASSRIATVAGYRLLAFIGVHSYSIYLWHMFVKRVFTYLRREQLLVLPWALELVGYAAGTIILGILMAKAIEIPVLKFRDRHFPRRAAAIAEPTKVGPAGRPLPLPLPR